MAAASDMKIDYERLENFCLDPMNPRLGRSNTGRNVTQATVLELMKDWTLEELAVSFLESGFWPQEALIVVQEPLYGKLHLVVVEGNRRIAALKYLQAAIKGKPETAKWAEIARAKKPPPKLFEEIPYIKVDSRKDVEAFLGFRHVTGIMEWRPAEKAQYIAKLIEDSHFTYEQVMRKIGSKTPTVRQNYISYRVLLQMEAEENITIENVEDKFSVLFLSLRTKGAQKYLQVDIKAAPDKAGLPVPPKRLKALANFAVWLFGDSKKDPLFTDSRQVDKFGAILESPAAVEYLERAEDPKWEVAYRTAGGDEPELVRLIEAAADNVELALSRVHLYPQSEKLRRAAARLTADADRLKTVFP
jgi:hypothetical protein